ncbi:equilibrative nucleoside transporter 1-like [Saccoglossus kowalevskii]|uniref:Equilibrative nucleoside transporter 1-like n=1 Tax=Saccoglossus kowalevskii TaxID=10224 RepID=A0ABM0MQ40_SACKO|nr:PREDICTED: equilibrative nucleoside transporter 1-like [Saccoglossus kowalevskii]
MVVKRTGDGQDGSSKFPGYGKGRAPLIEFVELKDIEFEIDEVLRPPETDDTPVQNGTVPNGHVPNGKVPNGKVRNGSVANGDIPELHEIDVEKLPPSTETSVLIKTPYEKDDVSTTPPPVDRFKLVYWIFVLHGIGTLLPWNMFITAEAYFTEHKFGNVSDNAEYKDKFLSYLGIAGFVPTLCFMVVTLFISHKTMTKSRIGYSIILIILLFVLTEVLAIIDTSSWPGIFYGITMGTIVIFNGASAVYQSSLFGLAGSLPAKYTQAVLAGQGLGGTFVSIVSILSMASTSSLQAAGVGYFGCALVVLVICFISFIVMNRLPFVKYYLHTTHIDDNEKTDFTPKATPPFLQIFWQIKWQIFNIWMVFFVTLTCFPAVLVQVETSDEDPSDFKLKYFTPVTCFLLFNLCDFVGSIFPAWIRWPSSGRLWIPSTLRLIFIPIFLFCNYRPYDRTLPVLINNDYVYIAIVLVFSLSSGYLKSLPMMAAPKLVDAEHASTAGTMMALFLVLGIFCGLNFSLICPVIVSLG